MGEFSGHRAIEQKYIVLIELLTKNHINAVFLIKIKKKETFFYDIDIANKNLMLVNFKITRGNYVNNLNDPKTGNLHSGHRNRNNLPVQITWLLLAKRFTKQRTWIL